MSERRAEDVMSDRIEAVIAWSRAIHPLDGDRHAWAVDTAAALVEGRTPAPFPSPFKTTRAARLATVCRLLDVPIPEVVR